MEQEKLTKLCKKCNTVKELKFMVKHSGMKDGYNYCCKECEKKARLLKKGKSFKCHSYREVLPNMPKNKNFRRIL